MRVNLDITERELLERAGEFLMTNIKVIDRGWIGPGQKSPVENQVLSARIPKDLFDRFVEVTESRERGGRAHHVERAIDLYVRILQAKPEARELEFIKPKKKADTKEALEE